MVNITALPTEVFLDIFERLNHSSLSQTKTVCKLFQEIVPRIPSRSHTLRIDEPGHSGWKFVRNLLSNPRAASQFTDLYVEWERRDGDNPDTWTHRWEWTEDELRRINELEKQITDPPLTRERSKPSREVSILKHCFH
ncbi:hypothetical protein TWF481_010337 [Arthrobotrys musiformis]|uniref:F-box domain-containing protein n=1 Tax=Arthrobotrys musiformis TaxID=47236 RepID=A0AAV9W1M8_9PEZI